MLTENILLKVKLPRYFQGLSHPSYNENEIYSKKRLQIIELYFMNIR